MSKGISWKSSFRAVCGIKVKDVPINKITYADDTTAVLTDSANNLQALLEATHKAGEIIELNININKTNVQSY